MFKIKLDQPNVAVHALDTTQEKGLDHGTWNDPRTIDLEPLTSEVARQARDFGLGIPILYWIGWLFVAYLLLYFLSIYVGPALFGTRPWNRPMYWGRNVMPGGHFPHPNPYMRISTGQLPGMDVQESTDMTAKVTEAVKKQQ